MKRIALLIFLFVDFVYVYAAHNPELEFVEGSPVYSLSWPGIGFSISDVHPEIKVDNNWISAAEFEEITWQKVSMPSLNYVNRGSDSLETYQLECTGHPKVESFRITFEFKKGCRYLVMNSSLKAKEEFALGGIRLISSDRANISVQGKDEDWVLFNESASAPHHGTMMYPDQLDTKKAQLGQFSKGDTGVWLTMLVNDRKNYSYCMASISGELWPNNFRWTNFSDRKVTLRVEAESSAPKGEEQIFVPEGKEIVTDAFIVGFWEGKRPTAVLSEVGYIMGQNVRKGKPMRQPSMGWSSWHTYGRNVSQDIIVRSADKIRDELAEYGWRDIQLDGGWWSEQGLYDVNGNFPEGIRYLSDYMKDNGLEFGLHISPLRTHPTETIVVQNREMQLIPYSEKKIDASDDEMVTTLGTIYYDTTHPFVAPYLSGRFQQMVEDYRPVFMKWDHHYGALEEGDRYDSTMTFLQGHNRAIRAIRSVLPDTLVVTRSMGYIFGALECYDALRIGQDINSPGYRSEEEPYTDMTYGKTTGSIRDLPQGKGLVRLARSVAQNYYIHNNIAICDPDAFFVTPQYTLDEAKSHMTLDAIMGGLFFFGDKVEDLPQERLDLLKNKKIIEVNRLGVHAVPLDLFSGADVPYIWKLETGDRLFIALFNWLDDERENTYRFDTDFELDSEQYSFEELWTGEKFTVRNGKLKLSQPAHSVRIYELKKIK